MACRLVETIPKACGLEAATPKYATKTPKFRPTLEGGSLKRSLGMALSAQAKNA